MLSSYGKHFSFPTPHIQKPFKPPKTDPRFVQRYHVKRGEERKIIILKFKLTSLACEWKDGFCRKRTDGGNGEKGSYEILHIDSSIPRYKSAQLRKRIPKLREEFIIYTHFHAPSGFGFPQTTHNSHTSQLYTRHGATNQLGIDVWIQTTNKCNSTTRTPKWINNKTLFDICKTDSFVFRKSVLMFEL